MTSDDPFLQDFIAFVKSHRSTPNTGLLIERISGGYQVVIYRSTMEARFVDVYSDHSIPALINKLLASCLVLDGIQQAKQKHTLRPSATDRLSQAGLRRYKRPGGRSTKKT